MDNYRYSYSQSQSQMQPPFWIVKDGLQHIAEVWDEDIAKRIVNALTWASPHPSSVVPAGATNLIDEVIDYAKANAEVARTEDDRRTWEAFYRNCLKIASAVTDCEQIVIRHTLKTMELQKALQPFTESYIGENRPAEDNCTCKVKVSDVYRARAVLHLSGEG